MKIGIVANNYISGTIGGAEVYFKSLLSGLDEIDNFNQYFIFVREDQIKYLPKSSQSRKNFTRIFERESRMMDAGINQVEIKRKN